MGELLNPLSDFDFQTIEKGTYKFKVKETKVEPQPEGKEHGKIFIAICQVVGGSQADGIHTERFMEKTKDNFSLRKLAGFCLKIGLIKNPQGIDSAVFSTQDFEERWKKNVSGREFGAKIGWRYDDAKDKAHETPYSDMKAYYTIDEYLQIINKGSANPSAPSTAGTTPTPVETQPATPALPAEKSIWD